MDMAKRQRIPVYDDIQAATECAVEKANMHKSIASIWGTSGNERDGVGIT